MNITELARRLKIPTGQLKDELPKLGFDIGRRAIKIDDAVADKVMALWSERRKQQQESQYVVVERKLGEGARVPGVKREVAIPPILTPREFAALLGMPVTTIVGELFKNGIMASINERIDYETATIIAEDLGFVATPAQAINEHSQEEGRAEILSVLLQQKSDAVLESRPPVVVVMGHVDHGKTTLLDALRSTNVAAGEAGAITQHIGAYQTEEKGRKITFLDTPGHEAFTAMRSRGGRLADVAIIVIAADDGLQPQTLEAIEIVQREKLSFVIAINKIDRETADIEKVKKALADINLLPEDWGGKTICVPISAKKKQGLTDLLDVVLLLADIEKFQADFTRHAVGTIIESHLDKGEGPVATALVQAGTLRVGDYIIAGTAAGKVRAMKDFKSVLVTAATPSTPIRVLGFKHVPPAGEIFRVVEDEAEVREILKKSSHYQSLNNTQSSSKANLAPSSNSESVNLPTFNIILKTDVLGSREAIMLSLRSISMSDVQVKVVQATLGSISEADVIQAEALHAIVLGFHVPILPAAKIVADEKGIFVGTYRIIYELLDEVKKQVSLLLKPELVRTQIGVAHVVQIFKRGKKDMIIGCKVDQGTARGKTRAEVMRGGNLVSSGLIKEIRLGKEVVGEVAQGGECGMSIDGNPVLEIGDILEIYHEEIHKRFVG